MVENNDEEIHSVSINDKSMASIDTMVQCTPGVDIGFKDNMPLSVTGYFDPEKKSYITLWVAPMDSGNEED